MNHSVPGKVDILGCKVSRVDMAEAVDLMEEFARGKHPVAVILVDSVMTARRDRGFRMVLNEAALAFPDGMPLVWASQQRLDALCRELVEGKSCC